MCYYIVMDTPLATMTPMGRYVWKFSDYLEARGINPYRIARHGKGKTEEQTIYRLARKGQSVKRLDLTSLALIIEAVKVETGLEVQLTDLLEYNPDN